ncbi:unnamed protein product [Anisakis simplex]|uniref:SH2 domain-containing protein n=1 Tax=Anisakis simplex TaxID=6269 RepID=A0A0M3IZ77_ANISI|nr:unnamed protein product [Anisakis simplex]
MKRCNTQTKTRPSVLDHCWSSTNCATTEEANGDEMNRKPLATNIVVNRTECRTGGAQNESHSVESRPQCSIAERAFKKRTKNSVDEELLMSERKYLQQYCVSPKNQRHSPRVIVKKSKASKHPIKSVQLSVIKKCATGKNSPSPKLEQRRKKFMRANWDQSNQEYRTEEFSYQRSDQVIFESNVLSDPSLCPLISYSPKPFRVTPNTHKHERMFRSQEITYGPGIVQKLRDKFAEMSNIATQNVRISPHSKRKRFPSADDILSDEAENRDQTPYRPENYLLKNSANKSVSETSVEASSSPQVEKGEQSKKFVVESMQHRSDAMYDDSKSLPAQFPAAHYTAHEEPPPRVQISSLREKFETAIWNRTTRSYSTPPHTYESDEPEFIRVQRRIRSQSRDQVLADITPSDGSYRNRFIRPAFLAVKKEQKVIEPETKDSWGLPQLKGSARIIVQSPPKDESSAKSGHPLPVRVAELISPPDPDTARLSLPEPTTFQPPPHYEPTESSPPPEEPKPLTIDVNRSGLDEMHRLLSKFSINRESKPIDDEEKNETTKTKPAESSDILRLLSSSARSLTKFDTENEQKPKFEDRSLKEEKNERKVEEAVNQNFPKTEIDRHVGKSFFQTDDLPKVEPLSRPATLLKDQTPMFTPMRMDDRARDGLPDRSWTTRAFSPKNSDILMLLSPTAQIQPLPKFHPR